ncbi:hypothetical protein ASD15_07165 [Massilia sp. Root351]|jgi:hypothetical protein|uniref:hypothetical protein n=1 Tax=Massilia sp. Root351 TaxID=1736522 RepID=UPI00070BDA22|nr:hypothetical protein [Massilia sp. Root351]KQV84916.1 hypothetical protein ASD15_07165 [Massilia sp. Root351]
MKISILLATVAAALTLTACEKTTVNNPPAVETPAPAAVPVPVPGPPGPQGAPGEPGKAGDTLIVVPDAPKPAEEPAPPPPAR